MAGLFGRLRAHLLSRFPAPVKPPPAARPARPPHRPRPVLPDATLLTCDVWPDDHVPNAVRNHYRSETSGMVTYRFNAAGYRGEDLDTRAARRICLVGESHAIGLGLPYERSFGHRFKIHLADALGVAHEAVNLVNLACTAASSDHCLRELARQIDIIRPHLVVAVLPVHDRTEHYGPEGCRNFSVSAVALDKVDTCPVELLGFIDFYTPEWGMMNTARNALLLQALAERHGAEHIILTETLRRGIYSTPLLQTFFRELDQHRIVKHRVFHVRPDSSVDGSHGGPRSHEAVAILILERYARLLAQRGEASEAAAVAAHVEHLKSTSIDWAFVQETLGEDAHPAAGPREGGADGGPARSG